jgi:hypothetical protein
MLSQLLDSYPLYENQWSTVQSFYDTITAALKKGVDWIVVQPIGDGKYPTDPSTVFYQIINYPDMKKKFYYKEFGWCKRPYWTHDKIWVSEDSVLFIYKLQSYQKSF